MAVQPFSVAGTVQRGLPFIDGIQRTITQPFGERNPIYRKGVHEGLDVGTGGVEGFPLGCPFPAGGEIIWEGVDKSSGGFGNCVAIRGNRGGTVLLAHLKYRTPWWRTLWSRIPGTRKVSYGQFVGVSGNTGNSTGPHLHIQCSLGTDLRSLFERPVDPIGFFALHNRIGG